MRKTPRSNPGVASRKTMNELSAMLAVVITASAPVFPKWEPVTPQTMLKSVPAMVASNDAPGSVTRYPQADPLPESCAIKEAGKLVGYRLNC